MYLLKLMTEKMNTTISLTFGDAGENHTGMEMLGKLGDEGSGFTCEELIELEKQIETATYHSLGDNAGVLIIRKLLDDDEHDMLFSKLCELEWDKKYFCTRRKKVLNKHARSNIMILDGVEQKPDYENAKGTIVKTEDVEFMCELKERLASMIGKKAENLICEGNRYENNEKNGIGFHGDSERRKVIALRLGASMDMHWQWFQNSRPFGDRFIFQINGGDLYIMSEKAVGNDWKKRSIPTLRHAAGAKKYTTIKKK